MANRLLELRNELGLSGRKLAKLCGVTYSVIFYLENEKRPFRQVHIDKLTAFFNVTSDYLLGRNDYGLIVKSEFGDDELILTENEYSRMRERISLNILNMGTASSIDLSSSKVEKIVYFPKYVVYRELKGNVSDYNLQDTLNAKLTELSKHMTTDELHRTIKFIEEYILKK